MPFFFAIFLLSKVKKKKKYEYFEQKIFEKGVKVMCKGRLIILRNILRRYTCGKKSFGRK